jgi:hypothetical protein
MRVVIEAMSKGRGAMSNVSLQPGPVQAKSK